MKHPNFPNRTIRHAEVMTRAGFTIHDAWMKVGGQPLMDKKATNVDKLIYWSHPRLNTCVCFFDYEQVSLDKLINKVIAQAQYDERRKAKIAWE